MGISPAASPTAASTRAVDGTYRAPNDHTSDDCPEKIRSAKPERIACLADQASWGLAQQPGRPKLDRAATGTGILDSDPLTPRGRQASSARIGRPLRRA